jgi:predicted amidophosphoribosyltransferase
VAPPLHCPVCGQLLPNLAESCPNRWCRRRGRGFSVAFALGLYSGALRRAIGRYKYRGERQLAPVFAGMVATHIRGHPEWFEEFSVITAVPSYAGPGARRSWDPVGAILAELPPRLGPGWAVVPGLVAKTHETPGMAGLGWSDRQAVARGPLRRSLRPGAPAVLDGAQVLLFDDVLTEGSTLREVAGVLRQRGASDVAALVVARPEWTAEPPPRTLTRVQM